MYLNFGLLILSFVLTLAPHTPLSTQRDVGLFSIRFWALSTNVPDAGDYNELAVYTTEFLDKTMENVFEDSPASHAFTTVNSYPDPVRRLMGYQSHGRFLGVYPGDPDGNWFDS